MRWRHLPVAVRTWRQRSLLFKTFEPAAYGRGKIFPETPNVVNGVQLQDHDVELALGGLGEGALGIPRQNRQKWNAKLADLFELDLEIGFLGFLFTLELN